MEKFSTVFGLKLGFLLFSVTEQLSCTLQGKDTTMQEAREAALLSERYLRKLRSEEEYSKFYEQVVQQSQGLTDEPVLPRKRKIPKRVNDGADPHQHLCPKDWYRQQYFEALDEVTNELSRRFDQKDIQTVVEMEKLLLSASVSGKDIVIPEIVENTYQNDFQMEHLKAQLKMLPDLIARHKELTGNAIKRVTNIRTLCDVMNGNPVAKRMCPDLHSLLKVYLTVPVTIATAERTFSTMRRLKTYLRSSMSQERLNHTL